MGVIVGSKESLSVAESYGFDVKGGMALSPSQIIAGTPGMFPRPFFDDEMTFPAVDVNADDIPIEAILIFYDPIHWAGELQVLTDVLVGGHPLGAGGDPRSPNQAAKVYSSNPDFVWQAEYPVPRYGQAAFTECLAALWKRRSGGAELQNFQFGKPHPVQFEYAELFLKATASKTGQAACNALERIYMIGDNPAADVRGANSAGGRWRSILV